MMSRMMKIRLMMMGQSTMLIMIKTIGNSNSKSKDKKIQIMGGKSLKNNNHVNKGNNEK